MNKATITGKLGNDPELKTYGDNKKLATFSLATNDGYGENKKTNWHRCTAFGKAAEIIAQYVKKGHDLCISGSIDYSEHEGKTYTKIIVSDFTLLGSKGGNNQPQQGQPQPQAEGVNEEDDDLPF